MTLINMAHQRQLLAASAAVAIGLCSLPAMAQNAPSAQIQSERLNSRAGQLAITQLVALDNPWGMALLPDGGLLITEKPGRLRLWKNDSLSVPIAGVPAVAFNGQGGLFDVILDPGFAKNGVIYLSYAESGGPSGEAQDTHDTRLGVFQDLTDVESKGLAVARARLSGSTLRDVRVIWRAPKTTGRGHFGGRMAFTADGLLLIASGDRQRFEPAQDRSSPLGKILRIRTDGTPAADNPMADGSGNAAVWSMGHRNPLGIAIRPGSTEIWLSEMGPQGGDEINVANRGSNYGWPLESMGDNYDGTPLPRPNTSRGFVQARHSFNPAISPSSLMFYNGSVIPQWNGNLLIGGLSSQAIIRGIPAADGVHDLETISVGFRVRDIGQAADGTLLVLKDGPDGGLMRVTPVR